MEDYVPGENPGIKVILELMDALLLEVRIDGHRMRVPPELGLAGEKVSVKDAGEAVMTALDIIRIQLWQLTDRLAKLDPDFFDSRLEIFLDEWPKLHPKEDLRFFWALKFYIEAHAEAILFNCNRGLA